jgi:putative PIN family toxin of toxin-antitoxin system
MRVVLDTNILVSALLAETGLPASIYRSWRKGNFTLLTCAEQLTELRATLRKQTLAARIKPNKAGRLVNELKEFAEVVGSLPRVKRSPDPTDDFLLALSEAGRADYLVTGDKSGLLTLALHRATRIVSASDFAPPIRGNLSESNSAQFLFTLLTHAAAPWITPSLSRTCRCRSDFELTSKLPASLKVGPLGQGMPGVHA